MKFAAVVFLYFVGLASCKPTIDDCSLVHIIPCAFLIDDNKPTRDGMWPADNNELNKHCESAQKVAKCMKPFVDRCAHGEFENIGNYLKAEHELLDQLCDKSSDLRKRYLKNAPCVNKNYGEMVEKCGTLLDFEDAVALKKEHCDLHKHKVECHTTEIQKRCGEDTLNLMKMMLDPANKLMDKICGIIVPEEFIMLLSGVGANIPF